MIQRVEAADFCAQSIGRKHQAPAELGEAVVAVAERRLEDSGYRILRQVRCRFEAGTLTLSGEFRRSI